MGDSTSMSQTKYATDIQSNNRGETDISPDESQKHMVGYSHMMVQKLIQK